MTAVHPFRNTEDRDYEAVAELVNLHEADKTTAQILRERDARWIPTGRRLQLVLERDGRLAACGRCFRRAADPAGKFFAVMYVHPGCEGRGIGRALAERLEGFAWEHGGGYVDTFIEEEWRRGAEFVRKAGYKPIQRLFESKLTSGTVDLGPFLVQGSSLEKEGYRFTTLAEEGSNEDNWRRVYELDTQTDQDTPGFENWGTRTFEQYCADEIQSPGYDPACVHLAVFDGQWVGMSALRPKPVGDTMGTDYTGVRREHRGRGIAQLLKALAIDGAWRLGAREVTTHNDDRNGPMLAINRKFGFVATPGLTVYRKERSRGA